jgi:hypothetical protein
MEDNYQKIIEIGDYRGNLLEHKSLFHIIVEDIEKNEGWEEDEDYEVMHEMHFGTSLNLNRESTILTWWEESPHKKLLVQLNKASRNAMNAGFFNFVKECMHPGSQVGSGDNPLQTVERNVWLVENADAPDAPQEFEVPEELKERIETKNKEIVREELEDWIEQNQGGYDGGEYMVGLVTDDFYEMSTKYGLTYRDKTDGNAYFTNGEEGTLQELRWWLVLLFCGNLIEDTEELEAVPGIIVGHLHNWPDFLPTQQEVILDRLQAGHFDHHYTQHQKVYCEDIAMQSSMPDSELNLQQQKTIIKMRLAGELVSKREDAQFRELQLKGRYVALLAVVDILEEQYG